jgi:hypothetical protein
LERLSQAPLAPAAAGEEERPRGEAERGRDDGPAGVVADSAIDQPDHHPRRRRGVQNGTDAAGRDQPDEGAAGDGSEHPGQDTSTRPLTDPDHQPAECLPGDGDQGHVGHTGQQRERQSRTAVGEVRRDREEPDQLGRPGQVQRAERQRTGEVGPRGDREGHQLLVREQLVAAACDQGSEQRDDRDGQEE